MWTAQGGPSWGTLGPPAPTPPQRLGVPERVTRRWPRTPTGPRRASTWRRPRLSGSLKTAAGHLGRGARATLFSKTQLSSDLLINKIKGLGLCV